MEYIGAAAVFGERAKSIPTSSNKSMIGHTLSAAGAVEAVLTLLTLEHQKLPPTINYNVPDPAIPIDVVPNVAARSPRRSCALELVRLRRPERLPGHRPRAGLIAADSLRLILRSARRARLEGWQQPLCFETGFRPSSA